MGFIIAMGKEDHTLVRKLGFVDKLRNCVLESRSEELEVEEYLKCMEIYKKIVGNPFQYTFDHMLMAEDALDAMLMSAVADQRKHRKYAEDALKQMQTIK
jgi:hypothetical protein